MARRLRNSWGSIRKLQSGRYQAQYTGPDLRRHNGPTTFTTKEQAYFWLSKERRLIEEETWTPPKIRKQKQYFSDIKFGAFAKKWLEESEIRESTKTFYSTNMKNHVLPKWGDCDLQRITTADVKEWLRNELSKVSPTSKFTIYNLFKIIINAAAKPDDFGDTLIGNNPCTPIKVKKPKRQTETIIASDNDITNIYNKMPIDCSLTILLGGICGLRIGEVCGLQRKNIDLEKRVIYIRQQYISRTKEMEGYSDLKTSASKRDVPIPENLLPIISDHLNNFVAPHETSPLFMYHNKIMNSKTLTYTFNRAKKAAGRPDLRFHDLRHTAGSNIAVYGDITTAMDIMGHTSAQTAMQYQHSTNTRKLEALNKVSDHLLLNGKAKEAENPQITQNDLTAIIGMLQEKISGLEDLLKGNK